MRFSGSFQSIAILACFLGLCLPVSGQPNTGNLPSKPPPQISPEVLAEPPSYTPSISDLHSRLRQLAEFLSLSPEELQRARKTIEMIEKMSPDHREELRLRLLQLQDVAPQLESEVKELLADLDFNNRQRTLFREFWISLRPEEREEQRSLISKLDQDARAGHLRSTLEEWEEERTRRLERIEEGISPKPDFVPPSPPQSAEK